MANLLDDHTSQILDENQDDLNFSIDLQRTIVCKQALHHVYISVLLLCDFLRLTQMESLLANQFALHYPVHKHLLFTLLH